MLLAGGKRREFRATTTSARAWPRHVALLSAMLTLSLVSCGQMTSDPDSDGGTPSMGGAPMSAGSGGATGSSGASSGGTVSDGGASSDGGATPSSGRSGVTGGSPSTDGGTNTTSGGTGSGGTSSESGGSRNFSNDGMCVVRHRSKATSSTMSGYEEIALTTADGKDTNLCVVRFQVERVGPAAMPEGCSLAAALPPGKDCSWTNEIRYSNPVTMLDTNGVCANSQLGLTAAKIAAINESKVTYGFAPEAGGHTSLVMRYGDSMQWQVFAGAVWFTETTEFQFDQKDRCRY